MTTTETAVNLDWVDQAPIKPTARALRLSPSSAKRLTECERWFAYDYILGLADRSPSGRPAILGSAVHHVVETTLATGDFDDNDAVLTAATDFLGNFKVEEEIAAAATIKPTEVAESFYRLRSLFDLSDIDRDTMRIEEKLNTPVAGGVPVTAIPDLVITRPSDGARVLADWKNAKRNYAGYARQLQIYALVLKVLGDPIDEALLVFSHAENTKLVSVDVSDEALQSVSDWLDEQWARNKELILGAPVKVSPGFHCRWCPATEGCAGYKHSQRGRWSR